MLLIKFFGWNARPDEDNGTLSSLICDLGRDEFNEQNAIAGFPTSQGGMRAEERSQEAGARNQKALGVEWWSDGVVE